MLSLSIKLDFYGCLKSHYQDPRVLYGEVLNRFQDASLPTPIIYMSSNALTQCP